MKKLFLIVGLSLTLSAAGFALTPSTAAAENVLNPVCSKAGAQNSSVCKDNSSGAASNPIFGPNGIATVVMGWIAKVVGVAAIITIIISGIMMSTAGGDSAEAATARKALTYSLIGLVVAVFAQGLVSFVLNRLKT